MMKNAFYFTLKALFVLEISKFLVWHFGHVGKRLDKKAMVNFKIMTSQTWSQTITINILPDISRSTGNQTMKSGRSIEYNIRNNF